MLASLVSSDDVFMNFRQYKELHCRILLYRQHEIAQMEEELFRLDYDDSENCREALVSRVVDEQRGSPCKRNELIQRIAQKLKDYGNYTPDHR